METISRLTVLAVLRKIKKEKSVLFGQFSDGITKQMKRDKWKEVMHVAESVGMVTGKPWQYLRDTRWCNWKKRTLVSKKFSQLMGRRDIFRR
jgi:hypothetical protein